MSDSKFSSELIYNFNALCARNELSFQIVKDFGEFMKKRAEIESEYAKKLNQHYKTVPGSGLFTKDAPFTKETKTLKDALQSISDKGIQVSDQHLEVSNKIVSELCKTMESWLKTKEADRKKIIGEGQKLLKSFNDAKANVQKNRQNYEKLMKESDQAKDALIKAEKDEVNQPDKKNLQQATRKASENFNSIQTKAKQAEQAYKQSVDKTNEELNTFKSDKMPAVLEQMQALEQDRWTALLNIVKSYRTIQESLPTSYQKELNEINTIIESAAMDADMKEIITSCKKEKDEEKQEFVAFKSKHEDTSSATTPSTTSTTSSTTTTTTKQEDKSKDGATFGTQTAEQKLEEEKKEKEREKEKAAENKLAEEKKKKDEELSKQKASQVKANLFQEEDDMFK